MIASYTSREELIKSGSTLYDPEKLPNIPQKQYEVTKTYNLGLILFLLGFIMPLCWLAGTIVCFLKWKHRDINWGIANLFLTILVCIGLSGFIAYTVIQGQNHLNGY